jgi:bifunctional DNA-binding transcriptional regulator/antitoxin component of YhaV-PrlF toxin-antitoxin module
LGEVALDDKYRVVLDRKTRAVAGIKKGDRLAAIPFKGGVILVTRRDGRFAGSLKGFKFSEERHEASRFIFRRKEG